MCSYFSWVKSCPQGCFRRPNVSILCGKPISRKQKRRFIVTESTKRTFPYRKRPFPSTSLFQRGSVAGVPKNRTPAAKTAENVAGVPSFGTPVCPGFWGTGRTSKWNSVCPGILSEVRFWDMILLFLIVYQSTSSRMNPILLDGVHSGTCCLSGRSQKRAPKGRGRGR